MKGGALINLINTPHCGDAADDHLVKVKYLAASRNTPHFVDHFNNTKVSIDVTFNVFEVLLHQEALLSLFEYGRSLQVPETEPRILNDAKFRQCINRLRSKSGREPSTAS